ncbi:MAG: hypothetical protein ACJ72H_20330 [Candidatus Sulfotelmatobacter sp.]
MLPPTRLVGSAAGRSLQAAAGLGSAAATSTLFHLSPGVSGGFPSDYGQTFCNIPGKAESTISTSGCNRPCTKEHEGVHLDDIKPCCNAANIEYLLAPNPDVKDRVKSRWGQWVNLFRPIAECRAYDVSVPCFDKLLKEKGCVRASLTPDERECCGEIQLNLKDDMDGQQIYKCNSTSRQMPRCPFETSSPRLMAGDDSMVEQQPDVDQQPAIQVGVTQQSADQQSDQALAHGRLRSGRGKS